MRQFISSLLLLGLIVCEEKLLEISSIQVKVPRGLTRGSEIVSDIPFRVSTTTSEDVALSLVPNASPISVSPSISPAGKTFHLLVTDPDELYANSSFTYELQAIGLITGYSQSVPVKVDVEINEGENPQFDKDYYEFHFEKNLLKRSEIGIVKLVNSYDLADSFAYTLYGSHADKFDFKSRGSVVTILGIPCNGNEGRIHNECTLPATTRLVLEAKSLSGNTSQTVITVAQPQRSSPIRFTHPLYETTLSTVSGLLQPMVVTIAKGGDQSSIIYSLSDKTGLFSLHPTNGLLSIQHPEFVDTSTLGMTFNLTARAVDASGNTQQATIVVHVKSGMHTERKLLFEQDSYNLTAAPGESGLGQLRLQSSSTRKGVTFSISEGLHDDIIQIHNRTGELRYMGEIEKEDQTFDLKIMASTTHSFAIVPVHIVIRGIGSCVPKFASKDIIVTASRTLPVDNVIHEFAASDCDADAALKFQILTTTAKDMIGTPLQDPDFSRLFRLDSNDSAGRLVLAEDISALEVISLRVEVQVSDERHPGEIPDRANLLILVQALQSSQSEVPLLQANRVPELLTLPANLAVGSYVFTVSAKPSIAEGRRSEFWFELNNGMQFFDINSNTGEVHTIASLRNETELHAQVIISHLNTSSSVQVPLHISISPVIERAPIFSSSFYEHFVDESTQPAAKIMMVAVDDTGDTIRYQLEGTDAEQFEVNEKGEIYLRTELDRETKPKIQLFAKAIDSLGKFDIAPVTMTVVDANDSPPFFAARNIGASVMEDAPIGSFVVRAKAVDPDSSSLLRYDIRVPNQSSMLFKLISVDGNGTVTTAGSLHGLDGIVFFEVIVSDGVHTHIAEVNMEIIGNFDCHPTFDLNTEQGGNFVFEIQENAPTKFALGQVNSEPLDDRCHLEFALFDSNLQDFVHDTSDLSIDEQTGELRTNRAYDAERDPSRIPVVIGLRAQKHFSKIGAELRVIDLNDNPLTFAKEEIHFRVPENSRKGTRIGSVEAHDKDFMDQVLYHMAEPSDTFYVDTENGDIILLGELDRERADTHSFMIVATNSNNSSPIQSAMLQVIVHVQDVNDNPPHFLFDDQRILINDATVGGAVLLRISAEDPDYVHGEEKDVFYRIAGTTFEYRRMVHPTENVFSIEEETGEIRLEKSIKGFTGGRFNILIAASDRNDSNGHENFATVKATIYAPSDVVITEVAGAPSRMTKKVLGEIKRKFSMATDSDVHVTAVEFVTKAGESLKDASTLSLVFTGRDSGEPIPAEKMVAKMDRLRAEGVHNLPLVKSHRGFPTPSSGQDDTIAMVSSLAPVFIVLLFFTTLLVIAIFIFSVMVCMYRKRYRSANKLKDDLLAINNSHNNSVFPGSGKIIAIKNGNDRQPSSTISTPSIMDSYYKGGFYDVQEAKMHVVNPEDD
ncbi:hypothetical protein PMAYCL1PPCAC_09879 [Pristionchus mayeri]|uniref:Cadherin domain-containing protein n=1 Tax=Pristionchus mayeri TaxID=1317129 RepID=A0AAN4ZGU3_9BILA|nr:hypothetical protein PMAYCL1PPCAC_09879 [Pristionchus mayeri]